MRQCRIFLSDFIHTCNFKQNCCCGVTGCPLLCHFIYYCTQRWLMKHEILTDYDAAQTVTFLPPRWMPPIYAAVLSYPALLLWIPWVGAIPRQPSEALRTEVGVYAKLAHCQASMVTPSLPSELASVLSHRRASWAFLCISMFSCEANANIQFLRDITCHLQMIKSWKVLHVISYSKLCEGNRQ